jgi:capsular exopolysaccharide synthesis family protein
LVYTAPPNPHASHGEGAVDLQQVARLARSQAPTVAAFVAILTALAVFVAVTSPREYTAVATVTIRSEKHSSLTPAPDADLANDPTASLLETEVGELQSLGLAKAVAIQLNLAHDPEFNPALKHAKNVAAASATPLDVIAGAVLGHVKINHIGNSYLLTVQAESRRPELAAAIANTLVQQFMATQRTTRSSALESGGEQLGQHLAELRQNVENADAALQRYKNAKGLLSAEGVTITEQEMSTLDQQVAETRAVAAEADARLSTAKAQLAHGSRGDDVGEALGSPVIQQLRQKRAALTQTLADLGGRYGAGHPKLLTAQRELADIDAQIQAEINRIVSNLEAQDKVAHQRLASVEASAGEARGRLASNNQAKVELDQLQRTSDAATSIYNTYLSKQNETGAEARTQESDATVVDWAQPPAAPSSPKRALIVAFGMLTGLVVGIGFVFVKEQLFSGLADSETIEKLFNRRYLGSIPLLQSTLARGRKNKISPIDYVVVYPLSSFTEAYRSLCANVHSPLQEGSPQVIAVTSSLPNEGKTTTCICMARTEAIFGKNTLLVDCDIRKRAINRSLDLHPHAGLIEVLSGQAKLDDVLVRDSRTELMILPLAPSEERLAKDVLDLPSMNALMSDLRQRFDLIILDTGPVILVTSARQLTACADAVIVMAHWRKTNRRLVRTSLRLLDTASAPIAGIALGMLDLRKVARVDPADPSSYYRAYHDYYAAG